MSIVLEATALGFEVVGVEAGLKVLPVLDRAAVTADVVGFVVLSVDFTEGAGVGVLFTTGAETGLETGAGLGAGEGLEDLNEDPELDLDDE